MKHRTAFNAGEEEDEEVDVLGDNESCKVKAEVETKHKDQWAPQAATLLALDPAEHFVQETANEVGGWVFQLWVLHITCCGVMKIGLLSHYR